MNQSRCIICRRFSKKGDTLCARHKKNFIWDSKIQGYRLKKRENGSSTRYIKKKFHKHEIELAKVLENYYGPSNVYTGYHPKWAISKKGVLLEFDMLIYDKKILIEYNGIQHYKFTPYFHKTKTRFEEQKRRDRRKARLAKTQGYCLIIFKYDEPLFEDYVINKIERHLKNGNIKQSCI